MLSRNHRFRGLGSLNFVYRQGQTQRSPALSLKFVRNSRRNTYRVAVVVSRKISKSAVVRNRIRRRVYEAAASSLSADNQSYDLVFTVFSDHIASVPFSDLQRQVSDLLAKAGLTVAKAPARRGIVESEGNQRA